MASSDCYATTPCILGAMDRLWFHKIVLCSESICSNKNPIAITSPNSVSSSSSSESQPLNSSSTPTDYSDDDITEEFSHGARGLLPTISTTPQNDSKDEDDKTGSLEEDEGEEKIKEILTPTRPNHVTKKTKPSATPTRHRTKTRPRLERTSSCKTLTELEQEEVKGFMDLGFIFDKDHLTPRMMSVIPGLQRLGGQGDNDDAEDNGYEEEEMKMVDRCEEVKRRPYLSEAWLIKRPDSPLLRLRMSRVSTTSSDMKKHLKLWAKTVANSAIQQHS